MILHPNSSLVIPAWINSLAELRLGVCATQLPASNSTFGVSGFIVAEVLGGEPDIYLGTGKPVVWLTSYAVAPGTGKPLWGVTNGLLKAVELACLDEAQVQRTLAITANGKSYGNVRMMGAYPLGEARRATGDQGQYAKMIQSYQFWWVRA